MLEQRHQVDTLDSSSLSVTIDCSKFSFHIRIHNHSRKEPTNDARHVFEQHNPDTLLEDSSSSSKPPVTIVFGRNQWLINLLVTILIISWVIAALVTQSYFLLAGIPVLTEVLAQTMSNSVNALNYQKKEPE